MDWLVFVINGLIKYFYFIITSLIIFIYVHPSISISSYCTLPVNGMRIKGGWVNSCQCADRGCFQTSTWSISEIMSAFLVIP